MIRTITLAAFVCSTIIGGSLAAQNPLPVNPLNDNAALSYWQAFALVPPIDDETRRRLSTSVADEAPIDEDLRKLVAASDNALAYLYRGAATEACGWGIAGEKGPHAYLPHLSKARELAHVALLRARIRFESGDVAGAMEDTLAAIQLGRHAGQEGVIVLINILVGFAIESQSIETIAHSLHRLNQAQRDELERRLELIRPALDMQAAMQGEKDVFLGWLIRELENGRSWDAILDLVSGDTETRITNRVKKASQEQLVQWAKDLGPIYDAGAEIMSLSPTDAMTEEQELSKRLADEATGNPLGELFLPSFGSARRAEARHLTRRALLKAAFAVFKHGPSVLDRPEIRDPFGDGPFELERTDGGAELLSDLRRGESRINLTVPGLAE